MPHDPPDSQPGAEHPVIWAATVELAPIEGDADPWLLIDAEGAFTRVVADAPDEVSAVALVEQHLGLLARITRVKDLGPASDADAGLIAALDPRKLVWGDVHTWPKGPK